MTAPSLLWTVARAAEELSISEGHLRRLVREKRIPFCRIGTSVRFRPSELQAWLNERSVQSVKK